MCQLLGLTQLPAEMASALRVSRKCLPLWWKPLSPACFPSSWYFGAMIFLDGKLYSPVPKSLPEAFLNLFDRIAVNESHPCHKFKFPCGSKTGYDCFTCNLPQHMCSLKFLNSVVQQSLHLNYLNRQVDKIFYSSTT